jgi:hypothetical protein
MYRSESDLRALVARVDSEYEAARKQVDEYLAEHVDIDITAARAQAFLEEVASQTRIHPGDEGRERLATWSRQQPWFEDLRRLTASGRVSWDQLPTEMGSLHPVNRVATVEAATDLRDLHDHPVPRFGSE